MPLTRKEFNKWFADYKSRWPAVGDYVARQSVPEALLDTWHQSMAAFDRETLEAITDGILDGTWEPIANVDLGQFGSCVRRLGREVHARRREERQRKEAARVEHDKPFTPLKIGSMADMYHACCAVYELLPGADQDVIDAAITLADDHTPYERDKSISFLEGAGLTWERVQEVAARLKRQGGRPMVPSAKEL